MDVNKELEITETILRKTLIEDNSPYCQITMNWQWNTNLRSIIDFNDRLREIGYQTTYEIYGDESREPHVVATFRLM